VEFNVFQGMLRKKIKQKKTCASAGTGPNQGSETSHAAKGLLSEEGRKDRHVVQDSKQSFWFPHILPNQTTIRTALAPGQKESMPIPQNCQSARHSGEIAGVWL